MGCAQAILIKYGAMLFETTPDEYLARLRNEYDGYRFANSIEATKVYNPWSILKSFEALENFGELAPYERARYSNQNAVFRPFWIDTAVMSTYFINFMDRQIQNVQCGDNDALNDLFLIIGSDLTQDFSLPLSVFTASRDPYTMFDGKEILPEFRVAMIQSGYYTFKALTQSEAEALDAVGEENSESDQLLFTVPNREVTKNLSNSTAFWDRIKSFVAERMGEVIRQSNTKHRYLIDDLFAGNPATVFRVLNERFMPLSGKSHVFDNEDSVCRFLVEILHVLKIAYDNKSKHLGSVSGIVSIHKEAESLDGYADIFIEGIEKHIVLELKLYRTGGKSCDTLLTDAITQIPTKRYCDQHGIQNAICYAVVFSQQTRRVEKLAAFNYSWLNTTYTQPQDKDLQYLDIDVNQAAKAAKKDKKAKKDKAARSTTQSSTSKGKTMARKAAPKPPTDDSFSNEDK